MANIKTTYQSFREWLVWVRGNNQQTANCTVAYLRNLEINLLGSKIDGGKLSMYHKKLISIDDRRNIGFDLGSIITELKKLKEVIDKEKKNESGKSIFGLDTLKNWSRAFNSYLAFLCDVTDCFTQQHAKAINTRFGAGAKNEDVESPSYVKRLALYMRGVHKIILNAIGIEGVTDKLLDTFHEVVNLAVQNAGTSSSVQTEFLINSSDTPTLLNWRSIILDNIECKNIENQCDEMNFYRIPKSLQYSISCLDRYEGIESRCLDIFESVMRAYRHLTLSLYMDKTCPVQIETLKQRMLANSTSPTGNIDFTRDIWRIHDRIKEYSRLFEIKFETESFKSL